MEPAESEDHLSKVLNSCPEAQLWACFCKYFSDKESNKVTTDQSQA